VKSSYSPPPYLHTSKKTCRFSLVQYRTWVFKTRLMHATPLNPSFRLRRDVRCRTTHTQQMLISNDRRSFTVFEPVYTQRMRERGLTVLEARRGDVRRTERGLSAWFECGEFSVWIDQTGGGCGEGGGQVGWQVDVGQVDKQRPFLSRAISSIGSESTVRRAVGGDVGSGRRRVRAGSLARQFAIPFPPAVRSGTTSWSVGRVMMRGTRVGREEGQSTFSGLTGDVGLSGLQLLAIGWSG